MRRKPCPGLVITLGDPAGIGPEIVCRALRRGQWRKQARFLLVGRRRDVERWWPGLPEVDEKALEPRPGVWFYPGGGPEVEVLFGRPSRIGAEAALAALRAGIRLVQAGVAEVLVTAPINKEGLALAGQKGKGHTEILREETGVKAVTMLLEGKRWRVALATTHLPVRQVAAALRVQGLMATIRHAWEYVARCSGRRRPGPVAVMGLNPHAGDGGALGDEEGRLIVPVLNCLRRQGLPLVGPVPADSAFLRYPREGWSALVALYHDQGLAALKALEGDRVINLTLGLPFPRVSPGHGTAYEIAGKGKARLGAMEAAIARGLELAELRIPGGTPGRR